MIPTPSPQPDYFMTAQEVANEQRLSVIVYRRAEVDAWVATQEAASAVGGPN